MHIVQKFLCNLCFFQEYKQLEREIEKNWPSPPQVHPVQSQESQNSGVILSAATAFTEKNI